MEEPAGVPMAEDAAEPLPAPAPAQGVIPPPPFAAEISTEAAEHAWRERIASARAILLGYRFLVCCLTGVVSYVHASFGERFLNKLWNLWLHDAFEVFLLTVAQVDLIIFGNIHFKLEMAKIQRELEEKLRERRIMDNKLIKEVKNLERNAPPPHVGDTFTQTKFFRVSTRLAIPQQDHENPSSPVLSYMTPTPVSYDPFDYYPVMGAAEGFSPATAVPPPERGPLQINSPTGWWKVNPLHWISEATCKFYILVMLPAEKLFWDSRFYQKALLLSLVLIFCCYTSFVMVSFEGNVHDEKTRDFVCPFLPAYTTFNLQVTYTNPNEPQLKSKAFFGIIQDKHFEPVQLQTGEDASGELSIEAIQRWIRWIRFWVEYGAFCFMFTGSWLPGSFVFDNFAKYPIVPNREGVAIEMLGFEPDSFNEEDVVSGSYIKELTHFVVRETEYGAPLPKLVGKECWIYGIACHTEGLLYQSILPRTVRVRSVPNSLDPFSGGSSTSRPGAAVSREVVEGRRTLN